MATFLCQHCRRETRFLSLQNAKTTAGVCRSTIYYWMERGWVHWRELPSGRRLICLDSLSRAGAPLIGFDDVFRLDRSQPEVLGEE
jgi:predicted DNA-binding transcriptional regulator AlpA